MPPSDNAANSPIGLSNKPLPAPPKASTSETKPDWRYWAKQVRDSLDMEFCSSQILENIGHFAEFLNADNVLMYSAKPDELSLVSLRTTFPSKRYWLPKVLPNKAMAFHVIPESKPEEPPPLVIGPFGLLEPPEGSPELLESLQTTNPSHPINHICMILPALTVDTQGNRLGYGGGYYDRCLPKLMEQLQECHVSWTSVIALPDALVVPQLPKDSWDIPVDWVITEFGPVACQAETIRQ